MYRAEFDVKHPQPGDKDLAEAIRKGINEAKARLLNGSALAQGDVDRVPGRFPSDSEREMWTCCAHGRPRGKRCKECDEECLGL